jgi:hypothetical protein
VKKKWILLGIGGVLALWIVVSIVNHSDSSSSPSSSRGDKSSASKTDESDDSSNWGKFTDDDDKSDDNARSRRGRDADFDSNEDAGSAGSGDFGATKQVEIFDPLYNMVGFTISIPQNWKFEGTILHGPGCRVDYQGAAYRAYSPDMQYGVQLMPVQEWYWADDQRALPKGRACKYLPSMSASEYGTVFASRMRPGSELEGSQPGPGSDEFMGKIESQKQGNGGLQYGGENDAVRIHYDWDGHSEEELLDVRMVRVQAVATIMVYPGNGSPGRPTSMPFLDSRASVVGLRAPRGKLRQSTAALYAISASLSETPQHRAAWSDRTWAQVRNQAAASAQITHTIISAIHGQEAISQQNAANFLANSRREHQEFMDTFERAGETRHQNFLAQMDMQSGQARDFQDYLLDQQYYVNPSTGETSTQSGRFNHTWSNGPDSSNSTSTIQGDSPNFNPNGIVYGNWTELQPIHH